MWNVSSCFQTSNPAQCRPPSPVCLRTSSSCASATPTTSTTTRRWSLCSPPPSMPSRRSSRSESSTHPPASSQIHTRSFSYLLLISLISYFTCRKTTMTLRWRLSGWQTLAACSTVWSSTVVTRSDHFIGEEGGGRLFSAPVCVRHVVELCFHTRCVVSASGLYDSEHSQAERTLSEELWPGRVQTGAEWPLHPDLPAAHQSGRRHHPAHDRWACCTQEDVYGMFMLFSDSSVKSLTLTYINALRG